MPHRRIATALVVASNERVRAKMRSLLEDSYAAVVVGEAVDGPAAIAEVERLRPQVVLMGTVLAGMDPFEATYHIKALDPSVAVLLMVGPGDPGIGFAVRKVGADGYLTTAVSLATMRTAVSNALARVQTEGSLDEESDCEGGGCC